MKILKLNYSDEKITICNVGAVPGSEAFLIITKQKAALIDSGYSFCAQEMIENIKSQLGERKLDYILLTHSHYDHVSGSAYCRSNFAGVKVAASSYAAKILSKPSAVAVMRELNESVANDYGVAEFEDKLDNLKVDFIVSEGDIIDLGDVSLRVIEAPGHTKCSIAFYVPQEKMLISCETMGVYASERLVAPSYLVGYKMSIDFIKRAMNMDIEKMLVPHNGILEGTACREFLCDALHSNELLKDTILEDHLHGKKQAEIIEHYKEMFYTGELRKTQPLRAFELNAGYTVPMIIKEFSK